MQENDEKTDKPRKSNNDNNIKNDCWCTDR